MEREYSNKFQSYLYNEYVHIGGKRCVGRFISHSVSFSLWILYSTVQLNTRFSCISEDRIFSNSGSSLKFEFEFVICFSSCLVDLPLLFVLFSFLLYFLYDVPHFSYCMIMIICRLFSWEKGEKMCTVKIDRK